MFILKKPIVFWGFRCFATNYITVLLCIDTEQQIKDFDGAQRYNVHVYTCMLFSVNYTFRSLRCNNLRSLSDFSFNKFSLCL